MLRIFNFDWHLTRQAFQDDPVGTNAELVADIMLIQAITLRSGDDITVMVVERRR